MNSGELQKLHFAGNELISVFPFQKGKIKLKMLQGAG